MRDAATGEQVPDPERFHLVKELFNLRLQGVPVLDLVVRAKGWGLTTRRGKSYGGYALSPSQMYKLLADKFYVGLMVSAGIEYRGNHEPMITLKEYERVQAILAGKEQDGPRARERFFTYQGLIRCGDCQAIVTREEKTNRYGYNYTYYRCCRKRRKYLFCEQPYIEQDEIERQILAFLGTLYLPQKLVDFVLKRLPEAEKIRREARHNIEEQLTAQAKKNAQRLARLRQLCVDGVIGSDELGLDRSKLLAEEQHLRDQLKELENQQELIEPFRECFSFLNEAKKLFACGDSTTKRAIVQSVALNLSLKDRTLLIEAKKPFSLFQNRERFSTGCNYTVPLELTLSKIVENDQTHPAAPRPASGASNARKIPIIF